MRYELYQNLAEPTIRFCEDNLGALIEQPANSWSSLAICLAGVFILLRKDRHRFAGWLGLVAILTGLTSFAYHASFTFIGQLGDLGSLFLLAAFMIAASTRTKDTGNIARIILLGTGIPLALTAIFRTIGNFNIGIPLFAILLISAITLETKATNREKGNLRFFWTGIAVFLIGQVIWWLDYTQTWCNPSTFHLINGHSIWHIASAGALLCLDQHYRKAHSTD